MILNFFLIDYPQFWPMYPRTRSTKDDTNALHPEGASTGIGSGSSDDNKTLLARVYQRWRAPLMRMLTSRLGNPHDAKEAVHDVFTRYIAAGKVLPPEE